MRNFIGMRVLMMAVLIIAVLLTCWHCYREKQPGQTTVVSGRLRVLNSDSIASFYETKYRDSLQAQIKAVNERYANWKANYKPHKEKAATAVIQYRNAPTFARCDSAISLLEIQVSSLETGISLSDTLINRQQVLISSYAGTVQRKDSVIRELSEGWKASSEREEVLKKQLKARNRWLKIGAGVLTVLAVLAVK
jgi:hypothetical protein